MKNENDKISIIIIANATLGSGLSGGDRIFIELARRWAKSGYSIHIFVWEEGHDMCSRNDLENVDYTIWKAARYKSLGFVPVYLIRTINGFIGALKVQKIPDNVIVYSASDFLPDSIPAFALKLKFKDNINWIAGFYLFAPNPFSPDSPYTGVRKIKGLFYYLSQLPIYWIVRRYADAVFVTSEPDVKRFITGKRGKNGIMIIRGGVDIKPSTEYLNSKKVIPKEKRKYDACFVGRLHPQKGVLELIDIWAKVCKTKPDAMLAMIGNGPLEKEVREKIKINNLEEKIDLFGFKDGSTKFEIFKMSKLMVHPAIYDSGGMAAAEGMAWGLPGVSFDLEALRTYYPKGMLKVPPGDIMGFADCILELLRDENIYTNTAIDARSLIIEKWNWEKRANEIMNNLKILFKERKH
ncbi:Glycosyltransferase Gtf1 [uncultured archaeon]|nr:Glycosyltransferase Gtf1 [uncultured archaeon]